MAPAFYSLAAASERAALPVFSANSKNELTTSEAPLGSGISGPNGDFPVFEWTPWIVARVAALFLLAGLAEIAGGWLVWQTVRAGKPWWWALLGSVVLVAYGFLPTLQPLSDFGRLYAVYGGIFIVMSYCWGVRFDGLHVDRGDVIGSIIALVGVGVALFWPRSS